MNILKKIKFLYIVYRDGKKLLKGGNMKALINTAAGWLKILTYAATIVGMAMGWIEPKVALMISMIASAVIKIATEITRITPNTKDDVFVAEIEKILKDKGVIKTA